MPGDPYRYFRIEARELVDQLGKGALRLEKRGGAETPLMLRLAHTLKGAARVVKQRAISDLAHGIEDLLAPYRDGEHAVPQERINGVLAKVDAIAAEMARLPGPVGDVPAPNSVSEPAPRVLRAEVTEVDELLDGLGQVQEELATVRDAAAALARIRQLTATLSEQLARPQRTAMLEERRRALAEQLLTTVTASERRIANGVERVERELRQAREQTEKLRLVPAASVFHSLERTARDAAQGAARQVRFEAQGGEIRLDGHVLDTVQGALVQLVRNAVVHGIEPESERRAAGKPPVGRVRLEVVRRGRQVSFLCTDDGRGLDLDAVRQAVERTGGRRAELDHAELKRLLLKGGISTSDTVTEWSGRGIGLDLVRDTVERLEGNVSVQTSPGAGTAIELRMPLSLAAFDALVVQAGDAVAAIPLDAVRRTLRIAPAEVARSATGNAVSLDGTLVPLVALAPRLSRATYGAGAMPFHRACSAVVVAAAGGTAAVVVDRLLGTEAVMQRPLPPLAPAAAWVAGAYIDGAGNARIVLDPEALVDSACEEPAAAPEPARTTPPILIVDDSLTTRMLEQSILESAGYQVALATSGEEGLKIARAQRFGLALVDIEMPGMDGFTFIERVRADPELRAMPCILVSSRASPDDRRRGADAGAVAYIVKSEFDQAQFLDRISRLVCA